MLIVSAKFFLMAKISRMAVKVNRKNLETRAVAAYSVLPTVSDEQ